MLKTMDPLKEKFKAKAEVLAAEIKDIIKNHGDLKLGEITVAQVYQGMRSIQRQIHQLLERRGVLTFDSIGQAFDPSLHEAVDTDSSRKYPDATVSREVEKGYLWEGKVLRAAKVVVARALPSVRRDERV